jgi:hypothetical protein
MKEAFGPYNSDRIEEADPPISLGDRVVMAMCLVCYVFVIWRLALEFFS